MLSQVRIGPYGEPGIDLYYNLDPSLGGYDLLTATGLETPPVNVNYSQFSLVPGGRYSSANTDVRNLVFTVEFRPPPGGGQTVLSMRRDLYHSLPPGERLLIRLWNDGVYEMRIDGYLEDLEINYFSKEPLAQISIVCPEPYLVSGSLVSETDLPPGSIDYEQLGDIPTGFTLTYNVHRDFSNAFRLFNDTHGDILDVYGEWKQGQSIRINTTPGQREVTRRDSSGRLIEHLMGRVEITGEWPMLHRGMNRIRTQAMDSEGAWTYDISYRHTYGGF